MLVKETLKGFSRWTGFIGILFIIAGTIQVASGFYARPIMIILGWVPVYLGFKLRTAKKHIDALKDSDSVDGMEHINEIFTNLASYFKIQGLTFIVSIVFTMLLLFRYYRIT